MIVGDWVLCYTAKMRKEYDEEYIENVKAELGVIEAENENTYTVAIHLIQMGEVLWTTREDIPKDYCYPARLKAWYNMWQGGGYQEYLVGYTALLGLYILLR